VIVFFSREKYEWIIQEPFNWLIKKDCPDNLRKDIENKLDLLKLFHEEMSKPPHLRNRITEINKRKNHER